MKHILFGLCVLLLISGCDRKKVSYKGVVKHQQTGAPLMGMLVTVHQCKSDGDNCTDVIVGQCYTSEAGEFLIDRTIANKSKKKWLTINNGGKVIAQKDDLGMQESGLTFEVTP